MASTIVARHRSATTSFDGGRLLLVALFAAVAIAVVALAVTFAPALTGNQAINGQAEASYTQAEQVRGRIFGAAGADAYTQAESTRGSIFGSGSTSGAADGSYNAVESTRSQVTLPAPAQDGSYDQVEQLRSQLGG